MKIKKHVPNFITCLNLICGCVAIVFVFWDIYAASYLIALAAVFDFLDGLVARLLKIKSDIGKQLDSLADIVSFGVAPGLIIGLIIHASIKEKIPDDVCWLYQVIPFIALLIPVFSALRLAKFNIDESQTNVFKGLATPANALFFASIPFVIKKIPEISNPFILCGIVVVMSFLLISRIHLFTLKFTNYIIKDNMVRYFFLGISLLLLIFLQYAAVPLIIFFYIFLSVINKYK